MLQPASGPPETGREAQLHRGLRRNKPHWHLDLGLPASETESIDPWSEVTQLAVRCSSSPSKLTQQQRALSQNSERDTAALCHDVLFNLGTEEGAHAPNVSAEGLAKTRTQPKHPSTKECIKRRGTCMQWNSTRPSKSMKWCHLQQHGQIQSVILSEVRQRSRNIMWHPSHAESKDTSHKVTYLQDRNGLTDLEKKLRAVSSEGKKVGKG